MATVAWMETWETEAGDRITAATETLAERFALEIPEQPPERDTRMKRIRQMQAHAEILDALVAATEPKTGAKSAPKPSEKAPEDKRT